MIMPTDPEKSFSEFIKDIKPLEQDKIISPTVNKSTKSIAKSKAISNEHTKPNLKDNMFSDEYDPFIEDSERYHLNFKQHEFQANKFKAMRSSHFDYQLVCDLHGLSIEQARAQVSDFLIHCEREQLTRVLIIPGRGFDKLRQALNGWLRQYPKMLAYCESPAKEGGKGVIRCQLKR
jgi:DNA-nicking Smr family endonuclease